MQEQRGFSFPKYQRLLKRSEFVHVQGKGQRIHLGPILACVCFHPKPHILRVGITTSRKVGSAVQRNRYRRLIRDSVRRLLLQEDLACDVVFIVKQEIAPDIDQQSVDQMIEQLKKRLNHLAKTVHT